MKSRTGAVLLLALSGAGVYVAMAQPSRKPAGAEKEVRAAVESYVAAFNRRDLPAFLGFWEDDAVYVDDNGAVHKGKKSIEALMKKNAPQLKGFTMKIDLAGIRFPKPDVAIEEGSVTLTSPDGVPSSDRYIAVWVKNNGRWLLNTVRDQPSATPAVVASTPMKQLEWLIGNWTAESGKVSVKLHCRWALNQQFIVFEYEVARPGEETNHVAQWIGWDPATEQIHSWVFDSEGGHGQAVWERDGNTWTSQAEGVLGDARRGTSVNSIQFADDDHFIWRSRNREIDGDPIADAEVKFTRQAGNQNGAAKEAKP